MAEPLSLVLVLAQQRIRDIEKKAFDSNLLSSLQTMERAAATVVKVVRERWKTPMECLVLCGPGNNGGDGYAIAAQLRTVGWPVRVAALGAPASGDAATMAARWGGPVELLESATAAPLIIDALFGIGGRPALPPAALALFQKARSLVAVDLLSGVETDSAAVAPGLDRAADVTVTFHAAKPAHLLFPAAALTGELVVADIGLPYDAEPLAYRADGSLFPVQPLLSAQHKYQKGHVLVLSGDSQHSGAARLAARAALRAGAGLVTVLGDDQALAVHAAQESAIMLRRCESPDDVVAACADQRCTALVLGPALPPTDSTRQMVAAAAASGIALVLDAGAPTAFADKPGALFDLPLGNAILTPHGGEFARLFPDIASGSGHKIEKAKAAAARAGATILYKGPDTVVAPPKGPAYVLSAAVPWLATAGAGDVLAGIIAATCHGRQMTAGAAAGATWLHAEAARRFGPGLTADDLPGLIPPVLRDLCGWKP
jgi:ADP-dependent NAD(P)H-hydrate dehydratase / NAD(P)H-hydrate epimerase